MQGFRRINGTMLATFEPQEVSILAELLDQLTELLMDSELGGLGDQPFGQSESDDVLSRLEWEMACDAEITEGQLADPVLQRLFPDAYPDDPAASFDFRRFTQVAQRDEKVDNCIIVSGDLRHAGDNGHCRFSEDHLHAWLTTLTNVRLAMAARLEITDNEVADILAELPDDDPRAWFHSVYEWVGWVQESLLAALDES